MEKIAPNNGKIYLNKMEMKCLNCTLKILKESRAFISNYNFSVNDDLNCDLNDAEESIERILDLIVDDSIIFSSDPDMG